MPGILFTSIGWGNLGLRLNDAPEDVTRRRENLRKSLSLQSLVFMNQTNSNRAEPVDGSIPTIDSDAVVTSQRGAGLAVLPTVYTTIGNLPISPMGTIPSISERT